MIKSNKKGDIKSTFVLGSTSEIAKYICIELAEKGCQKFHFLSRDLTKNKKLISFLKENYDAKITQEKFDLLSDQTNTPQINDFDLYLITAGYLGNSNLAMFDVSEAIKIVESNYLGLIRWLTSIFTIERLNKGGRLWVFSSVAGDLGRPSNYIYGSAKSALTCFCQGLLLRSYNKPFTVRIFKTGFVKTRMTIGKAPSALCMNPSSLAKVILRSPNKRGIEYLPWWWNLIMKFISLLPPVLTSRL